MNNVAKKIESILFPVAKIETKEILPIGFNTTSDNSHAIVADIDGGKRLLNVCSSRYELVHNSEIFTPIIDNIENTGIKYDIKVDQRDFRKFYLHINFMEHGFSVGDSKDLIFPRVTVTHSYDGTLKYCFIFGWFRLVCSNGLTLPVEEKQKQNFNIKGKHTASVRENLTLFFSKLDFFLTNATLVKKSFDTMADKIVLNPSDRIEEVLRATKFITKADMTDRDRALIDYVINVGKQEQIALDVQFSDWLVYNGINRLIHDNSLNSRHPELRDREDEKVLEFMLQ
jgi:hypothetical protein